MDTNDALFDDLEQTFRQQGGPPAIERLCTALRDRKDYASLFYAMLLKKRHELGVSPAPTGPAQDLPESVHAPYEEGIREAARHVGHLYLDEGQIPQAWMYFRMLGETEPVAKALEQARPAEGEDVQQLINIAFHENVHPTRGFDLLLDRFGICSAITTVSGHAFNPNIPQVREHCIKRLVRTLYGELVERLKAEVVRREGASPPVHTVRELMAGRDWLFEDEFSHVDASHLGAVTQMSIELPPCDELQMARELCDYGAKLSPRLQYPGDPPFENQYRDYGEYLAALAGDLVEERLAHFRDKADNADPELAGTRPAEVLINLLLRLDRPKEALAVARKHLAGADPRQIICPSLTDLCQKTEEYQTLAEVAREQGDPVHFMAGLLAASVARPE